MAKFLELGGIKLTGVQVRLFGGMCGARGGRLVRVLHCGVIWALDAAEVVAAVLRFNVD